MMTINLEKKLVNQNKKLLVPKELLLVKEYDKHTKIADDEVLERVGLNSNLKSGKNIKHRANRLKSETEKFNQERVFHISQIESLCKKYHLRFLETNLYKGHVDGDLPAKISTFEIAHGIKCDKYNTKIAAPPESFKLTPVPKDPLMFYQINDEYYYIIHKWGNDLNIFRRLLPILSNAWVTWFICAFVFTLPLLLLNKEEAALGYKLYAIFSLVVSVVCGLFPAIEERALRFAKRNEWNSSKLK